MSSKDGMRDLVYYAFVIALNLNPSYLATLERKSHEHKRQALEQRSILEALRVDKKRRPSVESKTKAEWNGWWGKESRVKYIHLKGRTTKGFSSGRACRKQKKIKKKIANLTRELEEPTVIQVLMMTSKSVREILNDR